MKNHIHNETLSKADPHIPLKDKAHISDNGYSRDVLDTDVPLFTKTSDLHDTVSLNDKVTSTGADGTAELFSNTFKVPTGKNGSSKVDNSAAIRSTVKTPGYNSSLYGADPTDTYDNFISSGR